MAAADADRVDELEYELVGDGVREDIGRSIWGQNLLVELVAMEDVARIVGVEHRFAKGAGRTIEVATQLVDIVVVGGIGTDGAGKRLAESAH